MSATRLDPQRPAEVDHHEVDLQYIGMTANSLLPGEEAGYWHTHSVLEELYIFLTGRGEMGLDDEVVPVGPGTAIRVGQNVLRTWRAVPDGTEPPAGEDVSGTYEYSGFAPCTWTWVNSETGVVLQISYSAGRHHNHIGLFGEDFLNRQFGVQFHLHLGFGDH